jgi:hypothetical protein
MSPRKYRNQELSPEEALIASVLRSYWFPAWQVIRGKRRRKRAEDIREMIEDLKSVRDLRADFVYFCKLVALDPEVLRRCVSEETGVPLDEMIDELGSLHRELTGREYPRRERNA